jgi:hypothetical protein
MSKEFRPAKPVLVSDWIDLFDEGNVLLFGQTGSGKTNWLERIIQDISEREKCKVIVFDLKREVCQMGFPEKSRKLRKIISERTHGKCVARAYPHKVLVPFALSSFEQGKGGKMRLTLPKHSNEFIELQKLRLERGLPAGYTYWRPFRLAFTDIRASDFVILLRRATEAGINVMELLSRIGNFKSLPELMKEVVGLISKQDRKYISVEPVGFDEQQVKSDAEIGNYSTYVSILTLLANLERAGFICKEGDEFALDLDAEMRNTKEWTTFSFCGVDDSLAALAIQAISRNIVRLRKEKHYPPLLFVKPEESVYAPRHPADSLLSMSGISPLPLENYFLSQARILGVRTLADVQVPSQLAPSVISHFRWIGIGRNNMQAIQDIHENIISVPDEIRRKFEKLEGGTWAAFKLGQKNYWYPVLACPSLAYHKKEGQDVLDWIRRQPHVELVDYESVLHESIKVSFKRNLSKAEKKALKEQEEANKISKLYIELGSKQAVRRETGFGLGRITRLLKLSKTRTDLKEGG